MLGAEKQRQQVFEVFTNWEFLQFKQVEIDKAEIIDQAIKRVIQLANATPGRGWKGKQGSRDNQDFKSSQDIKGSQSGKRSWNETTRIQRRQSAGQAAN